MMFNLLFNVGRSDTRQASAKWHIARSDSIDRKCIRKTLNAPLCTNEALGSQWTESVTMGQNLAPKIQNGA